jgi:hypothetical protein
LVGFGVFAQVSFHRLTIRVEYTERMIDDPFPPPVVDVRPLRFVWIGESIVSDLGNPAATTSRAILRALAQVGHHAVFLEERGNRPTTDMLRTHGAAPLRAFNRQFPDIMYRTYELPEGRERSVWLGRELSVADVVVVQDTAPAGVIDAIRQGTAPHIVRVAQRTMENDPPFDADLVLAPIGADGGHPLGPAVSAAGPARRASRNGVIVAAYDNVPLASAIAERLAPLAPALVSSGPPATLGIPCIPEVDLFARYADYAAAVVIAAGAKPLAAARALLPVGAGCVTFVAGDFPARPTAELLGIEFVAEASVLAQVTQRVESISRGNLPRIPPQFDAAVQADQLVRDIHAIKFARRSKTNGVNKRHDRQ